MFDVEAIDRIEQSVTPRVAGLIRGRQTEMFVEPRSLVQINEGFVAGEVYWLASFVCSFLLDIRSQALQIVRVSKWYRDAEGHLAPHRALDTVTRRVLA